MFTSGGEEIEIVSGQVSSIIVRVRVNNSSSTGTRYSNRVYSSFDLSNPVNDIGLMFGRESTGIPHDILRSHPDRLLRIPMVPEARSLNLSNSVAIVVYEVLRQLKYPNLATHEAIKGEGFLFNEKD